jgi:hypothetical protein
MAVACGATLLIVLTAILLSPHAAISVLGEWGYRHLVSNDAKVRLINDELSNPAFPLIMQPGSSWSAGVSFPDEMLFCKSVEPLEFVLIGPGDKHEYETPVGWTGADSFSYPVKGYLIQINVRVLETKDGQARISILATKTGP